MKKLFLHIGMPKTGSSAIQAFLALNYRRLKQAGIHYPKPHTFDQPFQTSSGNGAMLRPFIAHRSFQKIEKVLDRKCRSGLLNIFSSETLFDEFRYHQSDFFQAFKKFDLTLVIYVRRQDNYIQSAFNQGVKNHGIFSFREIDNIIPDSDFSQAVFNALNFIDVSKILIRPYEEGQFFGQSIYQDFVHLLDIEWDPSFILPDVHVNPSLNIEALKFRMFLNEIGIDRGNWSRKLRWNRLLQEYSVQGSSEKRNRNLSVLSASKRIEIINQFEKSNSEIGQYFLGTPVLFSDKKPESGQCLHSDGWPDYHELKVLLDFIYAKDKKLCCDLRKFLLTDRGYSPITREKIDFCLAQLNQSGTIPNVESSFFMSGFLRFTRRKKTVKTRQIDSNNFSQNLLYLTSNLQHLKSDRKLIRLISTQKDSFFVLQPFEQNDLAEIEIAMQIIAPDDTTLRVYYQTYGEPWDDGSRSLTFQLSKGMNQIKGVVKNDHLNGILRVDPGKIAGEYLIKSIFLRGRSKSE